MLQMDLALREIKNFLNTVTIKNTYFADMALHNQVTDRYREVLPNVWNPYYRHIFGDYILRDGYTVIDGRLVENSSIYNQFDEMMYVTSLDTGEEIEFTRSNLIATTGISHKKTLAAYMLPSRYYELLCDKYPEQVDLIKAIVYPVSTYDQTFWSDHRVLSDLKKKAEALLETDASSYQTKIDELSVLLSSFVTKMDAYVSNDNSLNADNYALLGSHVDLLHSNEQASLLERLLITLEAIKTRYDVPRYAFEECYPIVYWSVIWNNLYLQLLAQRRNNIRTPFVHPVHIWEYLESHGLANYRGWLSSKQEMFLYRNLRYILANQGKHKVLLILIDKLLEESGITAVAKSVVLSTENIVSNEHKATPRVITEALDSDQIITQDINSEELDSVLQREFREGLEPIYDEALRKEQDQILKHSGTTYLPTKLIELSRVSFNPKFFDLFNLFVTNTLFAIAAEDTRLESLPAGERREFTYMTYRLPIDSAGNEIPLTFREMLALLDFLIRCEINDPKVVMDDGSINADIVIPTQATMDVSFYWTKPEIPTTMTWHPYHRMSLEENDFTLEYRIKDIIDVEHMLSSYVNVEKFEKASDVGEYINTMFSMMKAHQIYACGSGDLLVNKAVDTIYRAILNPRIVSFKLIKDVTTYSDWFAISKDIGDMMRSMQLREDFHDAIASLITKIINMLLEGCNISYATLNMDEVKYAKMKQLIIQLCSIDIAFMDTQTQNLLARHFIPHVVGHAEPITSHTTVIHVDRPSQRYATPTSYQDYKENKPCQVKTEFVELPTPS